MKRGDSKHVRPGRIRLDASTACQLACPSCPTAGGATGQSLGVGFLRFLDFKKLIDDHPWVTAKYVVFEFQGRPNHLVDRLPVTTTGLFWKAGDLQRWRGLLDKVR